MKNYFNEFLKLSVFRFVQRLTIVCLFLSGVVSTAFAGGEWDASVTLTANVNETGRGYVYVSNEDSEASEYNNPTDSKTETKKSVDEDGTFSYSLYAFAKPADGYYFSKWDDATTTRRYPFEGGLTKGNGDGGSNSISKTITAEFEYIIKTDKSEIEMLVTSSQVATEQLKVTLYKSSTFTIFLEGEYKSSYRISSTGKTSGQSLSFDSNDGLGSDRTTEINITLDYIGTDFAEAATKNVDLKLVSDNHEQGRTIHVKMKEAPKFTFLPSGIEGCSYKVDYADALVPSTSVDTETEYQSITTDAMQTIKFTASLTSTAAKSYKFFGWQTIEDNGKETFFSYTQTTKEIKFASSTTFKPLFIPIDQATFIIKEESENKEDKVYYKDLQEALDKAAADKNTVVFNAPTQGTTGTLYPKADGTAYTIPSGVTLLIPGDAAYTCRNYELDDDDFVNSYSKPTGAYAKLTVSEGVQIDVKGILNIHGTPTSHMGENGSVISYGQIDLKDGASIITENGKIFAYGYITGTSTSNVNIGDGATLYELFQIADWRGGNGASSVVSGKSHRVFPMAQYYVQNIEAPLTILYGATHRLATAVAVKILSERTYSATLPFIVSGESGGLFCLTNNTSLKRTYDPNTDYVTYELNGGGLNTTAFISNVNASIYVTMNSSDYILPMCNNLNIVAKNITLKSRYDVSLLPGSSLTIDKDAVLSIEKGALIVVDGYDRLVTNSNGQRVGYFGSGPQELCPLKYTPTRPASVTRTLTDDSHARLIINGKVNIAKGAQLLTTSNGARIMSATEGAVVVDNNETAYTPIAFWQAPQVGSDVSWAQIGTTAAKLFNSDETYVNTGKINPVTYTYTSGSWTTPPATITADTWSGTNVKATMPDDAVTMTVTTKVSNVGTDSYTSAFTGVLSNTTDFEFAIDNDFAKSLSFDDATNTLSIKIKYVPRDNTETPSSSTLTLQNAALETFTTTLTAVEEYVPNFTISNNAVQLPTVTGATTSTVNNAFTITPTQKTVATLQDSRLKWTCTITDTDFNCVLGEMSEGKIANNTVTFASSTAGTQHATLTIIATYTPKVGEKQTYSQDITLTGTTLAVNTLSFKMPDQIWVTDKNILVEFDTQNNNSGIEVSLTNDDSTIPAAELIDNGDGTYKINALNVGRFTIEATQNDAGDVAGKLISKPITVVKRNPSPDWNWGVVYGNQSYTLPFDLASIGDGDWTLKKQEDSKNLLDYNPETKTLSVHNINTESSASFLFNQKETHDYIGVNDMSFVTTIKRDPRILPLTITNETEFDIIEYTKTDGVVYSEEQITIPAGGYVILQFVGIPGIVSFETSADLSGFQLFESVDAQDGTWKSLSQVDGQPQWNFQLYSPSQYVMLSNSSSTNVSVYDLEISLYEEAGTRNVHYAKVSATVYPENVGAVATQGGYFSLSDNPEELAIFAPQYGNLVYDQQVDGYYHMAQGMDGLPMIFNLYAKSVIKGYYFKEWTTVGFSPIANNLSWSNVSDNFQLALTINNVADMYVGYAFGVYQQLYGILNPEVYAAAKPESGEPNPEAVKIMNKGTLDLIPATYMGTWQANFALAEVVSTNDVNLADVTSPNATDIAQQNVVFNILGDDLDDFVPTIESGKGFSFNEGDILLSTTYNTYNINVTYTPQDIDGTHTATLTLTRAEVEGQSPSFKTATLTVKEDLTPVFDLSSQSFGQGTLGQESILDIVPSDKNKVAQVTDPSKIKWEATMSDGAPFELLSVAPDGTCKVRYFRTEAGDKTATLTLTATYTDATGREITNTKSCTISGSSTEEKAANTLTLKQNIVIYVDDAPIDPFSVKDVNNTAPITIKLPDGCTALVVEDEKIKPSGTFATGEFTITASQEGNKYFGASDLLTTTVTVIKHTPEVTWNWKQLYFGQTYNNPIKTNSDGDLTITPGANSSIVKYNNDTKVIQVDPLTEGEFEVTFTVNIGESGRFAAYQQDYTATIFKDPRYLRVDVNSNAVYEAVTIADQTGANVSYNAESIQFADIAGSDYTSRQWTMYFIGVPDQLFFTPNGNNAWQIEESDNGTSWSTTYASAKIPAGEQFSMSLQPNTTRVRISYATNADNPSDGALNSFYITPLQGVKANVDGLYLPISADPTKPTTKNVIIQYTSTEELVVYTSDPQFTPNPYSLPALGTGVYAEQTIVVESEATTEKEGRLYIKDVKGNFLLELPLYTYVFPQELPIQLATDNAQRFHYLATVTNYASWNMESRVITLQNAPSNTTRSFTFAFEGSPSVIRFNHNALNSGTWKISESANNVDWYEANTSTRKVTNSEVEQGLLSTTRYVKVEYTSPYSEAVEISNLIIVGDASVSTDVNKLVFTENDNPKTLTVTAINLAEFDVVIDNPNFTVTNFDKDLFKANGIVDVPITITWAETAAVEEAKLTIVNPNDGNAVLATVDLLGNKTSIINPSNVGIYTGIASEITKINGDFQGYEHRPIDLSNAFDEATQTKALFDYLFVYGETSTIDGSTTISTPTTQMGSNAKTPCYIYKRNGNIYELFKVVENVNSSSKAIPGAISIPKLASGVSTRIYITGFAPYASTGYTKEEEGVWLFRGEADAKLDIYLEDCYIYSRCKTIDGHSFLNRNNGEAFSEQYSRGSGGVLVFECSSVANYTNPFNVTIHTMDKNLLKSHYGCFMSSLVGRAFQVSSPIQVHLMSMNTSATTHLSFDDIWPTDITRVTTDGVVTSENLTTDRTNGFLSLQKQVNNAPSIDLGSPNTVVNFNGGQVELQNAQNVSDNYKTTMAISYRGGKFASFFLSYGMGSDENSGTVNFNDGTTTVQEMWVSPNYFEYYLCDKDEDGNYIRNTKGEYRTTCLRLPKNTNVNGGSHCMMRACQDPTSQGGAPQDINKNPLGLYKYPYSQWTEEKDGNTITHKGGWSANGSKGLVKPAVDNLPNANYAVESVTPNDNGTPEDPTDDYLNFWVPAGYDDSAKPEYDKTISYWKTCMIKIAAEYANYGRREVGGDIDVTFAGDQQTEVVKNLLYCKIDDNIKAKIQQPDFQAIVKNPAPEGEGYIPISPTEVADATESFVSNNQNYSVENKAYYITTATADVWNAFTAPFDVAKIYIVETYPEELLEATSYATEDGRGAALQLQAQHNANFAGFFAVTIALGQDKNFDRIYDEYMEWVNGQDKNLSIWNGTPLRGMKELVPFTGLNWATADFYLNRNTGSWKIDQSGNFNTTWERVKGQDKDGILMKQDETYSMLFPYCPGCEDDLDDRTYWDYWTGKFLIFESTDGPHNINGLDFVNNQMNSTLNNLGAQTGLIMGNSSFADFTTPVNDKILNYSPYNVLSTFFKQNTETRVLPTQSYLIANVVSTSGQSLMSVTMDGAATYSGNPNGPATDLRTPTVGGGKALFITGNANGINIAVAQPQYVVVVSATGAIIYSGYVADNVDVHIPSKGIYVVKGETEAQKIFY